MPTMNDRHIAELEKLIFSEHDPEIFNSAAAQCIRAFYAQSDEHADYRLLLWANQNTNSYTKVVVDYRPISRVVIGHCSADIIGRVPTKPQTVDSLSGVKIKSLFRNRFDDSNGLVVVPHEHEIFHGGVEGFFVPETLSRILSPQRHNIIGAQNSDS